MDYRKRIIACCDLRLERERDGGGRESGKALQGGVGGGN